MGRAAVEEASGEQACRNVVFWRIEDEQAVGRP